jgi:carbonic anhydrase
MQRLMEGFQQFRRASYPGKRELFEKLAASQQPHSMIITCADSRVVPEVFIESQPGELFVCRNVGNIVPPYAQFTGGVSAAIEYAVAVLGVANIVICGHSDCGAMKATLNPASTVGLSAVSAWLRHADVARHVVDSNYCCDDPAQKLCALTEENVVAQLDHLRTHPSVAARVAGGQLGLHGWVYDIETGAIKAFCAQRRHFVSLEEVLEDRSQWPSATPPARLAVTAEEQP